MLASFLPLSVVTTLTPPDSMAPLAVIEDGPTLELKVGDMASLPKGAVTTWHLTLPFQEIWFFGRPYEMAT